MSFIELFGPQRPPLPVEEALNRAAAAQGRTNALVNAAVLASPRVAAAVFEECANAMLEAADAFGQAQRIAAQMEVSIVETVRRAMETTTRGGGR